MKQYRRGGEGVVLRMGLLEGASAGDGGDDVGC